MLEFSLLFVQKNTNLSSIETGYEKRERNDL